MVEEMEVVGEVDIESSSRTWYVGATEIRTPLGVREGWIEA